MSYPETLTFTGEIIDIQDRGISKSGKWKALSFTIIIPNDDYPESPNYITFEIGNAPDAEKDKHAAFLQMDSIGDKVEVSYNVKGRKWIKPETQEVKYINSLKAWMVKKVNPIDQQVRQIDTAMPAPGFVAPVVAPGDDVSAVQLPNLSSSISTDEIKLPPRMPNVAFLSGDDIPF